MDRSEVSERDEKDPIASSSAACLSDAQAEGKLQAQLWYNSVPNTGLKERTNSRIFYQRNFNNWMKSQLIDDFIQRLRKEGCGAATVLDLCCGKGGDLLKWRIGGIKEIVMTDVAEVALDHCRHRYGELRDKVARERKQPFAAHFIAADATKVLLKEKLSALLLGKEIAFDLCSCQLALHYAFEKEEYARRLLWNAVEMLRPGGYFIGTLPNAYAIAKLLRKGDGVFENGVCRIEYADRATAEEQQDSFSNFQLPLFGAKLDFKLDDCVNCPEYLAYFPLIEKILEDYGMELVYHFSFPDAINYYREKNGEEALDLMRRMKALEAYPAPPGGQGLTTEESEYKYAAERMHQLSNEREPEKYAERIGTLSQSEWEVVEMYQVFAFRKKASLLFALDS